MLRYTHEELSQVNDTLGALHALLQLLPHHSHGAVRRQVKLVTTSAARRQRLIDASNFVVWVLSHNAHRGLQVLDPTIWKVGAPRQEAQKRLSTYEFFQ